MVAVGAIPKSLNPKLFHLTCVAHLFHNRATKVVTHFEDEEDQLMAKFKSATLTNKTRYAKFVSTGCQFQPVVTRWVSCLNATLYYENNLC